MMTATTMMMMKKKTGNGFCLAGRGRGSGVFRTSFFLIILCGHVASSVVAADPQVDAPFTGIQADLFANSIYRANGNGNFTFIVRGITAGINNIYLSMCKYPPYILDGVPRRQPNPDQPDQPLWCKVVSYNSPTGSFTGAIGNESRSSSGSIQTATVWNGAVALRQSATDVVFGNPTSIALSKDESKLFVLDNDHDMIYVVNLGNGNNNITVEPLLWITGTAFNASVNYARGKAAVDAVPVYRTSKILSDYSRMAYDETSRRFYLKTNDSILVVEEESNVNGDVSPAGRWPVQTTSVVSLAVSPDGQYLFLADRGSERIVRFNTSADDTERSRCGGSLSSVSSGGGGGGGCVEMGGSDPRMAGSSLIAVSLRGGGCNVFVGTESNSLGTVYWMPWSITNGDGGTGVIQSISKLMNPTAIAMTANDTRLLVADFQGDTYLSVGSVLYSFETNKTKLDERECYPSGMVPAVIPGAGDGNVSNPNVSLTRKTDGGGETTNVKLIAGLTIGGISFALLLVLGIWHRVCCSKDGFRFIRPFKGFSGVQSGLDSTGGGTGQGMSTFEYGWTVESDNSSLSVDSSKKTKDSHGATKDPERGLLRGLTAFSYESLKKATADFGANNKIGTPGAFGQVYRGVMEGGKEIAVKVMKGHLTPGKYKQFEAEVALQGDLNHVHVCKLLGFCEAGKGGVRELLLVYPYIKLGSLYDNLHVKEGEKVKITLDVRARVTIALHVAKGLRYLHEEADRPVYHRDVKSHNILIDMPAGPESLCAKLADFGIAKMGETLFQDDVKGAIETLHLCGTQGYMAPEYVNAGKVGPKNDVHAFGVVILELITGKKAVIEAPERQSLVSFVKVRLEREEDLLEILDPKLNVLSSEDPAFRLLFTMAQIAGRCTLFSDSERPSIGTVVHELGIVHTDARAMQFGTE